MFVHVIRGHATDVLELRTEWHSHISGYDDSYLGATAGVAENGAFIAMVRFAAPPVGQPVLSCLDDMVVQASTRTDVWNKGGSDDAGFVQIRVGVSADPDRLRDLYVRQQPVRMGPFRPEVLGGMFAWHGDNAFTLSAYFTSEDAARSGENLGEFKSFFDDINEVMQDLTYLDLHEPWLTS